MTERGDCRGGWKILEVLAKGKFRGAELAPSEHLPSERTQQCGPLLQKRPAAPRLLPGKLPRGLNPKLADLLPRELGLSLTASSLLRRAR